MQQSPALQCNVTRALSSTRTRPLGRGVTLVEIMVVVAIIAALIGILLPALGIVKRNAQLVTSQSNLRTIGSLMTMYSLDSRDYIVPSQFDYSGPFAKTQVRSPSPAGANPNIGQLFKGTWTDILWTVGKFGPLLPNASDAPSPTWDYRYDSPDYWAYTNPDMVESNPFRSKVEILKPLSADPAEIARPFGNGAGIREKGQPGYFAANDFFDARPNTNTNVSNWYTNAMIRYPGMSIYAVDSRAGETIPLPATAPNAWIPGNAECEVEFRYVGDACCMLFLDAHVTNSARWIDVPDLVNNRQMRVERLDQRN
jgi:prepilin-type N-terminal cleavage/methylation domain-containing protein